MSNFQPGRIDKTLDGRYKIKSLLGHGGMASVYKAADLKLSSRPVAVKVIHEHLSAQQAFRTRFQKEVEFLARLPRQEHIVSITDYNSEDNPYLVMDYLPGGDLGKRLASLKKNNDLMPLSKALHIMITLCDAVAFVHKHNIIHRDLKPKNVLFNAEEHPYLADFGIARLMEQDSEVTLVGTPAYMSPEQAQGHQLDGRTDIYSLGIMFYELLCGQPPFSGGQATLFIKHIQELAPDIRLINPDISDALAAVVIKALEKDPNKRFQTADEMGNALRQISVDSRPTQVWSPQERKKWKPSKFPIIIFATLLLTTISVLAFDIARPPENTGIEASSCRDGMSLIDGGDSFCLDVTEVTNAAYQSCVADGSCVEPQYTSSLTAPSYYMDEEFSNYPVIWVSWEQAKVYCGFVGKRLPTGEEWERAAGELDLMAASGQTEFADTRSVESYDQDKTEDGIYDLAGNVRELVDEINGINVVVKGHSFDENSTTVTRLRTRGGNNIGFRCASDLS